MRRAFVLTCLLSIVSALGAHGADRPAITGVAFARVYTTDPAAAQKFYGDTLGYKRLEANGKWIYPVNSSQWVEILTTPPPPQPNCRLAAVAFTTRNAAGLEKYLAAKGIRADLPLKGGQFGVHDPEGNLVIFVQSGSNKLVANAPLSATATSKRIIHVGFIVRDAAKEDAFWREILGFTPYWHGGKKDDVTDWSSMQVPNGTDWLEYMLNISPTPTLQQTGVQDHFSLGVTHMADAVAALAQNKCEGPNCAKTQVGRDGKVQLNLYDPDRTRVEFMEFTNVQEPCCSPFTGNAPGLEEDK